MEKAKKILYEFAKNHKEYKIEDTPYQNQGMNSWIFKGQYLNAPVMFKVSKRDSAKREKDALEYFKNSGLVPKVLYLENDYLLITEFVQGDTWLELILKGLGEEKKLLQSISDAIIKFIKCAKDKDKLNCKIFKKNLTITLNTCENVIRSNPELYSDKIFTYSLDLIESFKNTLIDEKQCLYFDDIGPDNIIIDKTRFNKFIDLESCWHGTVHLQIGALISHLTSPNLKNSPFNAKKNVELFYNEIQKKFDTNKKYVLACSFLKTWIRIVRFNGWNGWKTWDGGKIIKDIPKEKIKADRFAENLNRTEELFNI